MSNKFSTGLVREHREEREEQRRQELLKEKYDIREDIVVVEKSNTFKFIVRVIIRLVKTVALILLVLLAFIGLMGILFPDSRAELWNIAVEIYAQVQGYLGF